MSQLNEQSYDLYARMKTRKFMILAVTLMSHYFTKMAVTGPEGTLDYQELHEIHVAVGTIYSLTILSSKMRQRNRTNTLWRERDNELNLEDFDSNKDYEEPDTTNDTDTTI